ncbi:MAG: serine/threonine protein kinase [Planctomycetia bacterium]|nr:serine/threonine protein kinase [Planctomycetia bacterium]
MPLVSPAGFVQSLSQLPLLEPEQLQALRSAPPAADVRLLARDLVQRRWLTLFQANHLLNGRGGDLVLGSYILLEKLGEGGMGQVFKARHQQLHRDVALKVIRREHLASPDAVRRYRREVRAAAQLSHPNIVRAYDADQVGEVHFLVMEYVEGIDLAKLVQQRGVPRVELAVDYIRQAALGLQHAHERGLVHRDVKPHNLLVTSPATPLRGGQRQTDPPAATAIQALPRATPLGVRREGVVKLLDLGLARSLDAAARTEGLGSLTQQGSVLGTPDYIAPEQIEEARGVDARADLYSLGCTLYFLLGGQPPFPQGSLTQKLAWHLYAEPTAIEQLHADLPAGLGPLLRKLMAKKPEDRFQTAQEAAEILAAYCRPEAPVARLVSDATEQLTGVTVGLPDGAARAARTVLTPPAAVTLAAPVAIPVPLGRRSRRAWVLPVGFLGVLLLLIALGLTLHQTLPRGSQPATNAQSLIPPEDRFDWQPEGLVRVLGEHRLRQNGAIATLALRQDGSLAASCAAEHYICLTDPETLRMRRTLVGHTLPLYALSFSRDGKRLASAGGDTNIRIWDPDSGKEVQKCEGHTAGIHCVALSPDGRWVLSGSGDKTVRLWDAATGKEVRQLIGNPTQTLSVAFSPDGKLAVTSADGNDEKATGGQSLLRLWDVQSGKELRRYDYFKGRTAQITFSPDGRQFVCSDSSTLTIWDVESVSPGRRLATHAFNSADYSPNGRYVLSCTGSPPLQLSYWEADTGRELRTISAGGSRVAFMPDGRRVLFSSGNTLRLWDVESNSELRSALGHSGRVTSVSFSRDGRWLLSAGDDGNLHLWDVRDPGRTPRQSLRLNGHPTYLADIAPDGRHAVSCGLNYLQFWDLDAGKTLHQLMINYTCLAFSPNKSQVLCGNADKSVQLFDLHSGKVVQEFKGCEEAAYQVGFLLDGRLVFANHPGGLRIWEPNGGKEVRVLRLGATHVAISNDARWAYTGTANGQVSRWNLAEAEPKAQAFFKYHTDAIRSLALSPDGRWLASAGTDARVVIWDAVTGVKLREWQQPGGVVQVVFAPDGNHLATANVNTTIYLVRLDLPPAKP